MITYIANILFLSLAVISQSTYAASEKTWLQQVESATDVYLAEWAIEHFGQDNKGKQELDFKKNNLDRLTHMPVCTGAISTEIINLSKNYQQLTLALQCKKPHWKINRPIRIAILRSIVIAKTALPRDTVITESMLMQKKTDITKLHQGYYTESKSLVGSSTRYSLNIGQVIRPNQVRPRYLVLKQQQVVVSAKSKGLSINVKGIALENGFMDDIISIRNPQSNRVIEARVAGLGKVNVAL